MKEKGYTIRVAARPTIVEEVESVMERLHKDLNEPSREAGEL